MNLVNHKHMMSHQVGMSWGLKPHHTSCTCWSATEWHHHTHLLYHSTCCRRSCSSSTNSWPTAVQSADSQSAAEPGNAASPPTLAWTRSRSCARTWVHSGYQACAAPGSRGGSCVLECCRGLKVRAQGWCRRCTVLIEPGSSMHMPQVLLVGGRWP